MRRPRGRCFLRAKTFDTPENQGLESVNHSIHRKFSAILDKTFDSSKVLVIHIQVCQSVLDGATFNREVAPLEAIRDSFPKIVLVADRWKLGTTPSGVRIQNLMDWLLGEQ